MPYKANEARRHKIPRARYRVTNWPEYDRALQQRGSLTVWVTPEALAAWHPPRTGRRGRAAQDTAMRPFRNWGGVRPGLGVVGRGRDEGAGHGGTGPARRGGGGGPGPGRGGRSPRYTARRPSRTWGVLRPGLVVVGRGRNEVAEHAGTGRARRHAAGARGRRRRALSDRACRGDAGAEPRGRQGAPGRA